MFILCDPIAHVKGSDILNKRLMNEGIDAAVSPLHVAPADLGSVVTSIRTMKNVAGFGVTIPHKVTVLGHLDDLTPAARLAGSVNFVRRESDGRLVGTNIDGEGFIRGFENRGMSITGRSVLQLGAGGAGRAVAFAIAAAGASSLAIWNRSADKASSLAADVTRAFPATKITAVEENDPTSYDVVVNTTSAGMLGAEDMVIDGEQLARGMDVAEIVINPAETPLLKFAREKGLRSSNGADMLEAQYELMRDFIGLTP